MLSVLVGGAFMPSGEEMPMTAQRALILLALLCALVAVVGVILELRWLQVAGIACTVLLAVCYTLTVRFRD